MLGWRSGAPGRANAGVWVSVRVTPPHGAGSFGSRLRSQAMDGRSPSGLHREAGADDGPASASISKGPGPKMFQARKNAKGWGRPIIGSVLPLSDAASLDVLIRPLRFSLGLASRLVSLEASVAPAFTDQRRPAHKPDLAHKAARRPTERVSSLPAVSYQNSTNARQRPQEWRGRHEWARGRRRNGSLSPRARSAATAAPPIRAFFSVQFLHFRFPFGGMK